jgi:hypothetical protein
MNTQATSLFLAAALAVTLLSSCVVAFAADDRDTPQAAEVPEAREAEVMDVRTLRGRLRGTPSISLGGKLRLQFEIDALVHRFRLAHNSGSEVRSLKMPFDALLAKIGLMLDRDPQLAIDLAASHGAIWAVLIDPAKFTSLG